MNKIVILFALVAVVVGEPPVNYGAPQEYSAPVESYGAPSFSGYSDDGDDGSQFVDDALLARVASLIEQNEGSSGYSSGYSSVSSSYGAPSSSYGAPSSSYGAPSSGYGAPSRSSGGGIFLSRPEPAQRVAEFDLADAGYSQGGYSQGGYSQGGYN